MISCNENNVLIPELLGDFNEIDFTTLEKLYLGPRADYKLNFNLNQLYIVCTILSKLVELHGITGVEFSFSKDNADAIFQSRELTRLCIKL